MLHNDISFPSPKYLNSERECKETWQKGEGEESKCERIRDNGKRRSQSAWPSLGRLHIFDAILRTKPAPAYPARVFSRNAAKKIPPS